MLHSRQNIILTALLGATLLTLNLTVAHHPVLGLTGLTFYAFGLSGGLAFALKEKQRDARFWGLVSLLPTLILLTTLAYYLYGITKLTSLIVLWLPTLLLTLPRTKEDETPIRYQLSVNGYERRRLLKNKLLLPTNLFLLSEALLVITLIAHRTTNLLRSPWTPLQPWFFIIYLIASGLLFYLVYKTRSWRAQIILTSAHLLTTYLVTPIMYPLGFGFDAFVHRATEVWIQMQGAISPKQPYYVGQYSLVAWLSNLTAIPIFYVDIYLVPILTALLLPAGVIFSLQRAWSIAPRYAAPAFWLIPFLPYLMFYLTTPHNVVLLFSLLTIFSALAYLKNNLAFAIPLLLSLAAAATHPLVGAPLAIFVATAIIIKRTERKTLLVIAAAIITLALLLPLLFTINNLRVGAGLPTFTNPLTMDKIKHFFGLVRWPYWYLDKAPLIFEILYLWQRLIVPTALALGLIGFWFASKDRQPDSPQVSARDKSTLWLFPAATLGFFLGAWLLRSWLVFPDVVSYEQGDFPLRLLKASVFFLLPFGMYTIYKLMRWLENKKRKKILLGSCLALGSVTLMLSWYLSYPQRNPKTWFPGLNVTQPDFAAVEWIHDRHDDYQYVVLGNQLVSAAALTNYSFIKYHITPNGYTFYYSVPTGGWMYKYYGKMLYEGQKREFMDEVMKIVGVDTAYFVLNSYWADAPKIVEGAKKTANYWHVIGDGKVWIFVYENKPANQ